jgi:hypothetical protein
MTPPYSLEKRRSFESNENKFKLKPVLGQQAALFSVLDS